MLRRFHHSSSKLHHISFSGVTRRRYSSTSLNNNNSTSHLPPLLSHAIAGSSPAHQHQQVHAYYQGNYSSYPYYGQLPHETSSPSSSQQQTQNQQHQQQNSSSSSQVQSFADRVHAERREFLERGYFAVRTNHISFVICCVVVATLVPDMFDNHLAESMRYQLLMKDTSMLEKKKIQPGFAGLSDLSEEEKKTAFGGGEESGKEKKKKVSGKEEEKEKAEGKDEKKK